MLRKTAGTPKRAASRLPAIGPPPRPTAPAVARMPKAIPRRSGGVSSVKIAWTTGIIPPRARPVPIRSRINCQTLVTAACGGQRTAAASRQTSRDLRRP